jgi:hypothetical protein
MTFGLAETVNFFVSVGLRRWLAYVAFAEEALGGGSLPIVGILSRLLGLAPLLLGAIIFGHGGERLGLYAQRRLRVPGLPSSRQRRPDRRSLSAVSLEPIPRLRPTTA